MEGFFIARKKNVKKMLKKFGVINIMLIFVMSVRHKTKTKHNEKNENLFSRINREGS